jgi:hypothetical protein
MSHGCRNRLTSVVLYVLAAACSEETAVIPQIPICTGDVTLTMVSYTDLPIFTWTPTCNAVGFRVWNGAYFVWWVHDYPPRRHLLPPVVYGRDPGGTSSYGAEPLLPGQRYVAQVLWLDPQTLPGIDDVADSLIFVGH